MISSTFTNQAAARDADVERACDHPGCTEAGEHRAPRSRDHLDSYYWFCRDHARSYNAQWNFFGDMDRESIEDYQKEDVTWHRPTWKFGINRRMNGEARVNAAWRKGKIDDPYGVFEGGEANGERDAALRRMPPEEREALAILNLPATATDDDIKGRYKSLVKRLHPDVNGNDKQAVDQLMIVIESYRTLSRRASG